MKIDRKHRKLWRSWFLTFLKETTPHSAAALADDVVWEMKHRGVK